MTEAPERIWIQGETGEPLAARDDWKRLKPAETTEYIRADIHAAALAREAAMKAEIEGAVFTFHVEPEGKAKHQGVLVL